MPVPNPEYNPDWEKEYELHNAERFRLQELVTAKYRANDFGDEYKKLDAAAKEHNLACNHTFVSRHKTIQDYAEWMFKAHPPQTGILKPVPVHIPDFETFKTINEVAEAWSAALNDAEQGYADSFGKKEAGQPSGMKAFSDSSVDGLFSYWREFTEQEFYPNAQFYRGVTTSALVTVDQRQEDGLHICFMYDPKHVGASVINEIENLATVIFREAKQVEAEQKKTEKPSFVKKLMKPFSLEADNKELSPQSFHFYTHVPPRGGAFGEESFAKVEMEFKGGSYHSPKWTHYDVVPEALQKARFEAMQRPQPADVPNLMRLGFYE